MRKLVALFPLLLIACSGSNFDVVEGSQEDATADSTEGDSSTDDTSGGDTASDSSVDPETDAASADVTDSSGDDASADTTDSAADTATDTAPETCVKNACGGCSVLVGSPGDPCLSCGGKLACKGTDKLECDSSSPKNVCGGCSVLAIAPETACGVCGTGKYKCDGTDATKCNDPVTGPHPMTACGTCGTKKVICDATAVGGTRCESDDANACGGCGTLSPALGGTCGACGTGTYVCDSVTKGTKCNDPIPASPKVGDACGTCKTLKYACAVDKKSVVCPADDANECGGCTKLVNKPSAVCGACSSGKYVCKGTDATTCSDPVTTPPGTICGICSKSTFACTGGTTACTKPDDRTDATDVLYPSTGPQSLLSRSAPGYPYHYAISFSTQRTGSIAGFSIGIYRSNHDLSITDPGTVQVRLIKGTPTLTPAASDVLSTISLPGDAINPAFPYVTTITLPTPTASFAAGTAFFVELSHNSSRFDYQISGNTPATPSKVDWNAAVPGDTTYTTFTSYDPNFSLAMKGCY